MIAILVLVIFILIYSPWINLSGTFSSGDWPYLFLENIREFSFFEHFGSLWIRPYYEITAKIVVENLGIKWEIAERLLWFWPFLVIVFFSSYFLFRSWVSVLIYTTNTYILMIVGGGQLGVSMAYAITPLIIRLAITLRNNILLPKKNAYKIVNSTIIFSFIFAIQVLFDPRIAYVLLLFFLSSAIFYYKEIFYRYKHFLFVAIVLGLIAFVANSFWIIPFVIGKETVDSIIEGYSSLSGFRFLSVADFSHAFSLLHPNWPENIFGKTYFLQPEFLILPILAFSSLFMIRNTNKDKKVLLLSFIILLGTFLSKGANEPFSEINIWIYENIPGMNMFRDASKFYILIILGYAFLIPYSLEKFSKKFLFGKFLSIVFIIFWCFLIRQAVFGDLNGTFNSRAVPQEYINLKNYIVSQQKSVVSVWIPGKQRFGFSSSSYPSLSIAEALNNKEDALKIAKSISRDKSRDTYEKLRKLNVQYLIVPYDSEGELFLIDRKYNDSLRSAIIWELDKTDWLTKIPGFNKITVYKIR